MALALLVVVALVFGAAAAQQAKFIVASAPDYVHFDDDAGPINGGDVASVISNALGFESVHTLVEWSGLYNGNVFRRPSASLSVVIDGFTADLPLSAVRASYDLIGSTSLNHVLVGRHTASVASVVSENAHAGSYTFSMSSTQSYSLEASARDMTTNQDTVVFLDDQGNFRDASSSLLLTKSDVQELFGSGLLGSNVVFSAADNTMTVTVGTQQVALSLHEAHNYNLFAELHAMVGMLQRVLPGATVPAVFTFAVSSAKNVQGHEQAVAVVLAGFVQRMTALVQETYKHNALVTVAAATPGSLHQLSMRAVQLYAPANNASNASNASNATPFSPKTTDSDYVPFCANFTCKCNRDVNGLPFDENSGNKGGCQNPSVTNCSKPGYPACQCAYQDCDCNSQYRQPGSARCSQCQTGFRLQGRYCYVDSDYPGMFQIWFWGGLALALALFATCHTIGGMDPGRNSVIYRMTSQRPKTN